MEEASNLTKKQRIQKFGEVFTPEWVVEDMLDMLEKESPDCFQPEKTFLEPCCGEGVFLIGILRRKFAKCETRTDYTIAIKSVYAMELQADNVEKSISAVTAFCEGVFKLTKEDRQTIKDHIIQADSLKVLRMINEMNEREAQTDGKALCL